MSGRLAGQACLVTGGASGIGEGIVRRFAREGARVLIADIQQERGEALARELDGALFMSVDVREEAQVAAAVDRAVATFGALDCMVNNAGVTGATGSILDISAEGWSGSLSVLLDSAFYGMKHGARVMTARRSGCILTTASVAGQRAGLGPHPYTAAKFGVIGLTQSVASELARHNIRVNAVAPGAVATALSARSRGDDFSAAQDNAIKGSPLGEAVTVEDVAAAFLYLASEDGRHITGQTIAIDGGRAAFQSPRPGLHGGDPGFFG